MGFWGGERVGLGVDTSDLAGDHMNFQSGVRYIVLLQGFSHGPGVIAEDEADGILEPLRVRDGEREVARGVIRPFQQAFEDVSWKLAASTQLFETWFRFHREASHCVKWTARNPREFELMDG